MEGACDGARLDRRGERMSIAEILLEKGLLRIDQIDEALALQRAEGLRLDRAILQLGFLSERQLLGVMSEHLHLPVVNLDEMTFDPEILRSLPPKIVYRKRMVPISRTNGTLKVATSDAFDLYALDDIRLMTGLDIQPVLAPRDDIEKAIKTHYGLGGDTLDEMVGEHTPAVEIGRAHV